MSRKQSKSNRKNHMNHFKDEKSLYKLMNNALYVKLEK